MNDLRTTLEDYLIIRRSLGFKLCSAGRLLYKFVLFAEQEGASFITRDLALRWAIQPKNVLQSTRAERFGILSRFARYVSSIDPRTETLPQDLLPYRYQRRTPYIYSDNEISLLIESAQQLPSKIGLRPYTYSTLFGLIAVTGMRISEAIHLNRENVDLTHSVITIYQTKFGKNRLVPVHPSTRHVLQQYEVKRDQVFPHPKSLSFFVSDCGNRLTGSTVRWTFVKVSCWIGLRKPSKSHGHGPCLHELRHAFAVRTILNWYRAGLDVEREIPKLATYLGHAHVNDTYWYLQAVPELMQLATMRLETIKKGG